LPGTVDEHPNWRRRLAAPAEALLNRPDVAARLAALDAARKKN
jgi:4-alpha-glucanotransferase